MSIYVGCGRDLSAGNDVTCRCLTDRCRKLVGVNPSDNTDDNSFVPERFKMPIKEHSPGRASNFITLRMVLITLRMVAEYVAAPETWRSGWRARGCPAAGSSSTPSGDILLS
jgi:hypothetical protein